MLKCMMKKIKKLTTNPRRSSKRKRSYAITLTIAFLSLSNGKWQIVRGQDSPSAILSASEEQERQKKGCETQSPTNKWNSLRKAIQEFSSTVSSSTYTAGLAATATIAATAAVVAAFERETQERDIQPAATGPGDDANLVSKEGCCVNRYDEVCNSSNKATLSESKFRTTGPNYAEDVEYVEGAKLLSASLQLLSSSVGLVADTVRVLGDTAAGVAGSSIKVMGSAVKSVASGMESAGNLLEGTHNLEDNSRMHHSSQFHKDARIDNGSVRSLVGSTRSLALQSVRLTSSFVRGVGDLIVFAGAATESITSSTAGVAEDAVRIVEGLSHRLASAVEPHGQNLPFDDIDEVEVSDLADERIEHQTSYISYGTRLAPVDHNRCPQAESKTLQNGSPLSAIMVLSRIAMAWVKQFIRESISDTSGVPSLAPQLVGLTLMVYVMSLALLGRASPKEKVGSKAPTLPVSNRSRAVDTDAIYVEAELVDVVNEQLTTCKVDLKEGSLRKGFLFKLLSSIVFLPFTLTRGLARFCFRVIFSRGAFLFVVHALVCLHLARTYQSRVRDIQRYAAMDGFRSALSSIGTTAPATIESAVWLNSLLGNVWRVPYDPSAPTKIPTSPSFLILQDVDRAKNTCNCDVGDVHCDCVLSYGGLEPYISSLIGTALMEALNSSVGSRPSDVAYVSLYSFTLGSSPPIIREIELRGVEEDGKTINFGVNVDMLMGDLSVVLVVKLSSLEYSLMPSTKLSVNTIDMKVPVDISATVSPVYPFVSTLNISLAEIPPVRVRITPLSDNSGLRGVDLGSLPVISTWIQDAIELTLSDYVSPRYISIDMSALFASRNCEERAQPATMEVPVPTKNVQDTPFEIDAPLAGSHKLSSAVTMRSETERMIVIREALAAGGVGKRPVPPAPSPVAVRPAVKYDKTSSQNQVAKKGRNGPGNALQRIGGFVHKTVKTIRPLVIIGGAILGIGVASKFPCDDSRDS